jgi:two-component system, NtrC family, response regulator
VSEKPYLLIVEDDPGLQEQLRWTFESFDVVIASSREEAITLLRRYEPPVVTLDLGLPPDPQGSSEGLATLREILDLAPHTKVVMVTGNSDRHIAMQAIDMGAYDYYEKPIEAATLDLIIQRAFYLFNLEKENIALNELAGLNAIKGLITSHPAMQKVCQTVKKVAPNNISILFLGESGTGKEVLAKALHNFSDRAKGAFVAINCAAIPDALLESELFGYEKGAFTGATKQTPGKIEMAHKGTLFLDEIGDLPLALQPKLLRFLQERVIERLGGRQTIPVDVRIVCATHHDLNELIKRQLFREDLYYRLSEITVPIPPLRERVGDSVVIARVFLAKFAEEFKRTARKFSEEALEAIQNYSWPGNVRELENKIKRAVIMAEGNKVTLNDLDLPFCRVEPLPFNLKKVRDSAEKSAIARAISYADGNVSRAAELLGVTRPTLYNLMEKLNIYSLSSQEKHV